MKKLSKLELDIVVNEVMNGIKVIEENKCKELFDKSENKDLFLNKVKEIEELENKVELLKNEIREIENKFKEDNLRVFFNSKINRSYGSNKSFNISLINDKSNSYSLYKEIEKCIVLEGISSDFDIKKFIEELIEKFK
jgi:predicted  nucleic acid-binding Zn-ribbon protein